MPLIEKCEHAIGTLQSLQMTIPEEPIHSIQIDRSTELQRIFLYELLGRLHADLASLQIWPPALAEDLPHLEDWNRYLARIAVKAEYSDLEGARKMALY